MRSACCIVQPQHLGCIAECLKLVQILATLSRVLFTLKLQCLNPLKLVTLSLTFMLIFHEILDLELRCFPTTSTDLEANVVVITTESGRTQKAPTEERLTFYTKGLKVFAKQVSGNLS